MQSALVDIYILQNILGKVHTKLHKNNQKLLPKIFLSIAPSCIIILFRHGTLGWKRNVCLNQSSQHTCQITKEKGEVIMKEEAAKFTLRTSKDVLWKFHYIADYNGRSSNRQLEILLKRYIASFENKHGPIVPK